MTTEHTGAASLVAALEDLGIDRVYGVPGEETTALMAALEASSIAFVLCRHEQSAAFMASVHGRLTGRPGVCLSTLGPGATNLVTGVADAQLDHAPLIAISGQGARARLGRTSHQMIDLEALFRPVTKLSRTLLDAGDIAGSVAEAVRVACDGRPGAVHLSLPEDVAAETVAHARSVPAPLRRDANPAPKSLDEVAQKIGAANRPVILAGAGVIRAEATAALRGFSEVTQIPVATSFAAKGLLPETHPNTLFSLGQPDDDWVDLGLSAADLIIAVGFDPVEYPAGALTQGGDIPVVVIDSDAPRADAGWHIAAQAVGEIGFALSGLQLRLKDRTWPQVPAFAAIREGMIRTHERRWTPDDPGSVAPIDICRMVSEALRADDTVLSGVGLHKLWIARHVHPRRPNQVIVPNGLAGMGLALPGALAAAQLRPEGRVLAICGDGDLMMNVQEMETIARISAPVTVMVWEDGGYGLIDAHQGDKGPQFGFGNPDWDQLARAFGWTHARVSGLSQLGSVLRDGMDAALPTLMTVPVDYALNGTMPGAQAREIA